MGQEFDQLTQEQREQYYRGALDSLGVVMETLRSTGWNPFADDAPSKSSFDSTSIGAQRISSFVNDETSLAILGAYHYEPSRSATRLISGEYRYMQVERGDGNRPIDLCDIRTPDGGRIRYIAFDAQTAAFLSDQEVHQFGIQGVLETYHSGFDNTQMPKQVVIGTEARPDGTIDLFINFDHQRHETESMLERAYRINLQDYIDMELNGQVLFGLEGTVEMIREIINRVPEMFRGVEEDICVQDYTFEISSPNVEGKDTDRVQNERYKNVVYLIACARFEDAVDDAWELVRSGVLNNRTGFTDDELKEKISTGWVLLYENELLPFELRNNDGEAIHKNNPEIVDDDEIVANIARRRIWVQRGQCRDYRIQIPEEIDPENVYELLKMGYVDISRVLPRIRRTVWQKAGMQTDDYLTSIEECIRFSLSTGTMRAEKVSGQYGFEYRLSHVRFESDEDIEEMDRHFQRIELMTYLARPQDYQGSLRAMVEAGFVGMNSDVPLVFIEDDVVSGVMEYTSGEEVTEVTLDGQIVAQIQRELGVSDQYEVYQLFVRNRVGYSEGKVVDLRENIDDELYPDRIPSLLKKGYINVSQIEDLLFENITLFDTDDPDTIRGDVAEIIVNGLQEGSLEFEVRENEYLIRPASQDTEVTLDRNVTNTGSSTGETQQPIGQLRHALAGAIGEYSGISEKLATARMPESLVARETPSLPEVAVAQLEEKFGVKPEILTNRIKGVINIATKRQLIQAGMWSVKGPMPQNQKSGPKGLEIETYRQGPLIVNTAFVLSAADTQGIVGVLTDVDTNNPDTIKTMVVDYRKVIGRDGKTRLIVTCLQKDMPRANIEMPTLEDGGYVFEFEFSDDESIEDPEKIKLALQALDLTRNLGGETLKVKRYILASDNGTN